MIDGSFRVASLAFYRTSCTGNIFPENVQCIAVTACTAFQVETFILKLLPLSSCRNSSPPSLNANELITSTSTPVGDAEPLHRAFCLQKFRPHTDNCTNVIPSVCLQPDDHAVLEQQ